MPTNKGAIILVEDDEDDQFIITSILKSLSIANKLIIFGDAAQALEYLKGSADQPFLILCDINMPRMNGFEFKKAINNDEKLTAKSIPFIFLTTGTNTDHIFKAYELTVQGYFVKGDSLSNLEHTIKIIYDYWAFCKHPNS